MFSSLWLFINRQDSLDSPLPAPLTWSSISAAVVDVADGKGGGRRIGAVIVGSSRPDDT